MAERNGNCAIRPTATEEARLLRICELLARAVTRKCRREEMERLQRSQPEVDQNADPIVQFVSQVGEATPKEVRERFSLSRATAFRRLTALTNKGELTKTGNTRNTKFVLPVSNPDQKLKAAC